MTEKPKNPKNPKKPRAVDGGAVLLKVMNLLVPLAPDERRRVLDAVRVFFDRPPAPRRSRFDDEPGGPDEPF